MMFTIQYTQKMMGVGQLRWQFYRSNKQNTKPCPDSVVLALEEKRIVRKAT